MSNYRWLSLLRLFSIGVVLALPLACMQVTANTNRVAVAPVAECSVGSQGCSCTAGGGCDPGLYCDSGICVGDSDDDEDYRFEDDMLSPSPAPVMAESATSSRDAPRGGGRERRVEAKGKASRKLGKRVTSSAEMAPTGGIAAPAPAEAPELTATEQDPADHGDVTRQVIYTALLHVAVFDLDAAAELTESLPQRYGGWIESRYDYQITIRIRANRLFDAMKELMALGVVLDRTLLAEDVTAEYIDLDSRILVLEEIVAQLEALLARATSVEQALKIRVELDRIRIELEAARVRMRQLAEMIDFSTLTVILSPRTDVGQLPTSNDPFPWVDDLGVEITAYR
ncbi:DUF4349 domain-containing protein [Enhygromyxa salina]|nr:DUF4349 domain-containing protein [Enhygromyxa salina]